MEWIIAILIVAPVVWILFFREDQFTRYARHKRQEQLDSEGQDE